MADPKYAALFLAESREHLRACNQLLLAWERDAAASEPVNGLFRAIHNIKGMAATMGYSAVADLAHRAESVLETVRGGRVATPELIQLLFRSVDALEKAIEGAAAGKDEPPAGLLAALDRVASAGAPVPAAPGASAATPPVARGAGVRKGPVGHLVGVTIRGAAPMRGARALLALQRAETLGRVTALRPPSSGRISTAASASISAPTRPRSRSRPPSARRAKWRRWRSTGTSSSRRKGRRSRRGKSGWICTGSTP